MNPNAPIPRFAQACADNVDTFKGLLIILVVLDHNDFLKMVMPALFKPLTFHVLGFLALPFLLPMKPLSGSFLRDRFVRYLVPFWWVLTLATIVYWLMYKNQIDPWTHALDWFAAAAIGSAPLVKASAGFYYLWFLPCLAGLIAVLAIFQTLSRAWRWVMIVFALCCHAFITTFSGWALTYVPLGLVIVFWVFPLGLLTRWAVSAPLVYRLRFVVLITFLGSYGYLALSRESLEVMLVDLRAISDPWVFLMQDLSAVAGVLVTLWLASKLGKMRFIALCGKHSLMLYLLHPFIFLLGVRMSGIDGVNLGESGLLTAAGVSVLLTVLVTLALALGLAQLPVARSWLTPKGWDDWGPVHLVTRLSGARRV